MRNSRPPWKPKIRPLPRVPLTLRQGLTFVAHCFKATAKQHHRELAPIFRPLFPEDAVIFDVGAHAGQFAKLFARLVPGGTVYSFEPGRYARLILMVALALNRVANVLIFPVGLGRNPESVALHVPVKSSGSYGFGLSHLGVDEKSGRAEITETVRIVTLDDFCAFLQITRVDFIKADIEGWEMQMLKGAEATLRRFRPVLYLEIDRVHISRSGDTVEALTAFLADHRYLPFSITPQRKLSAALHQIEGDIVWIPEERVSTLNL
ncbi:MAG: FkbM family methyltransferase [Alphaproteobacteria bacterium]|nr:FkbM family methyltransferase [Alphaproteobacteria bacterium]